MQFLAFARCKVMFCVFSALHPTIKVPKHVIIDKKCTNNSNNNKLEVLIVLRKNKMVTIDKEPKEFKKKPRLQ